MVTALRMRPDVRAGEQRMEAVGVPSRAGRVGPRGEDEVNPRAVIVDPRTGRRAPACVRLAPGAAQSHLT